MTEVYDPRIDTGVRMPEPAHVARNRAAGAMLAGRANLPQHRFDNAKERQERGGYRRYGRDFSKRNEGPSPDGGLPMPLWRKRHGFSAAMPNSSAPASNLKEFTDRWYEEQREKRASARG